MKYFTKKELVATSHNVVNEPNAEQLANLEFLVELILDPARELFGKPIKISSGFRSYALNKKVGGALTSQHSQGEAVDMQCSDNAKLFDIIKKQGKFDQLIWEFGNDSQPDWVHVSVSKYGRNRREMLKAKRVNGKTSYTKIQ